MARSTGSTRWILARQGTRQPKTNIVVTVRRQVVVTVRGTHVRRLIVERAPTQDTATWSSPSGSEWYRTDDNEVDTYWPAARVPANSSSACGFRALTIGPSRSRAAFASLDDETAGYCPLATGDELGKLDTREIEFRRQRETLRTWWDEVAIISARRTLNTPPPPLRWWFNGLLVQFMSEEAEQIA